MNIYRPLKAIRLNCLDCCCDSAYEVKMCPLDSCPLWPYRFGHYPKAELIKKADIVEISTAPRKKTYNLKAYMEQKKKAKLNEMEGESE